MTAARDALDAEQAERRRREDSAFTRYAEASAQAAAIVAERDGELDRLEAEGARVRERAGERLAAVEGDQLAVLAELNGDGRSAEDLAALFGLPVKRVRTVLRTTKSGDPVAANAASAVAMDGRDADGGVTSGPPRESPAGGRPGSAGRPVPYVELQPDLAVVATEGAEPQRPV